MIKHLSFLFAIIFYNSLFAQTVCSRHVADFDYSTTTGYSIQGTANLVDSAGILTLYLSSDFSTSSGPDLYIYLTETGAAPTAAGNDDYEIAILTSNTGAQSYTLPSSVGINDYDYVTIHCKQFNHLWNSGLMAEETCITYPSYSELDVEECFSYKSPSGNMTWTTTGEYSDTLIGMSADGGDSIITIDLTINTVNTEVLQSSTSLELTSNATNSTFQWINCSDNTIISGETNASFTPMVNGSYAVEITSSENCIDTSACFSVLIEEECVSYLSPSGIHDWTSSGFYSDTLIGMSADGGDSIITIDLTINTVNTEVLQSSTSLELTSSATNSTFQWINCSDNTIISGETNASFTPTESGSYSLEVTSSDNCVDTSQCFSVLILEECVSYLSPSGMHDWTNSGLYSDTLVGMNSEGGDSIITIDLTISTVNTYVMQSSTSLDLTSNATNSTFQWINCDDNTIISGETNASFIPTESGNYALEVTSSANCVDRSECFSVLILEECDSYLSPSGIYEWTNTGLYSDTLMGMNSNGGDSIIKIDLTISPVNTEVVQSSTTLELTASATNSTFQWVNCEDNTMIIGETNASFIPTESGDYAVIITTGDDCEVRSSCFSVLILEECQSYLSPSGMSEWTNSGLYSDTLVGMNADGDDSIIKIDLTINTVDVSVSQSSTTEELSASASNATFQWIDCSDNSIISGETNSTFTPTTSGNYAVVVTSMENCSDTSECFTTKSIGIYENENNLYSVYPNPTSGIVNIEAEQMDIKSIEVFNLLNQRVKYNVNSADKGRVNISIHGNLGIYHIKFRTRNGNLHTIKLIKH